MVGRAVAEAAPRNGLANGDLLHVYLNAYVKFEANYYRSVLFCINTSQCPSLRPGLLRKGSLQSPRLTPFVPSHSITIIIARMPWHMPTDDFQRIVFVLAWHWFLFLGRLPCFADIFSECLNKSCPHPREEQVLVMLGFLGYNHLRNLDHSLSLVVHFTGGNWVWKELGNPCKVSVLVKMTKLFIQRQLWILRPSNLLNKLASVKK